MQLCLIHKRKIVVTWAAFLYFQNKLLWKQPFNVVFTNTIVVKLAQKCNYWLFCNEIKTNSFRVSFWRLRKSEEMRGSGCLLRTLLVLSSYLAGCCFFRRNSLALMRLLLALWRSFAWAEALILIYLFFLCYTVKAHICFGVSYLSQQNQTNNTQLDDNRNREILAIYRSTSVIHLKKVWFDFLSKNVKLQKAL